MGWLGIEVIERAILPEQLPDFSECFLTGSAAEVTPASEIGPYRFTPATIFETLMNAYMKEVHPAAVAAG
ncbi:aminotransferase class 4 domain-containing protein [Rhizobium sp. TAL182]|nr:aminotransferase class 4 domain-containing protein [Rhizobium sp. TAL182]